VGDDDDAPALGRAKLRYVSSQFCDTLLDGAAWRRRSSDGLDVPARITLGNAMPGVDGGKILAGTSEFCRTQQAVGKDDGIFGAIYKQVSPSTHNRPPRMPEVCHSIVLSDLSILAGISRPSLLILASFVTLACDEKE
jgi:hypothetical protein